MDIQAGNVGDIDLFFCRNLLLADLPIPRGLIYLVHHDHFSHGDQADRNLDESTKTSAQPGSHDCFHPVVRPIYRHFRIVGPADF